MADARPNMVSYLDIGLLNGGPTSNIVQLGDGFTEITEDWGADISSTQYVNMSGKSSTVKGYDFSITLEREHMSDATQTAIDSLFKSLPVGAKCNTFYYRFYASDMTGTTTKTGDCIKVPVVVVPSSTGGKGEDVLTSSIEMHGNGNVIIGTGTVSSEGALTWAAKAV